jgi:hypothetical protein
LFLCVERVQQGKEIMAKTYTPDKQLLLDGNAADGSFGVSVQDLG